MTDGPDFFALFQQCKLIPQFHTAEIIAWLRFFKAQANYQTYLAHYLPLLSLADRQQFIGDVESDDLVQSLMQEREIKETPVLGVPETVTASIPVVTESEPVTETVTATIVTKKAGRPKKA